MDSLITAAGQALAAGDPLGALKHVALRDDPPALALRGIAMAQLGDFERARVLLRRAARAFGPREAVARARCAVAEAEVALAARDLASAVEALDAAAAVLEAHGDALNGAHARYLLVRRLLLIGRLDAAEAALDALAPLPLPPALRAAHALMLAGVAMRRLQAGVARQALDEAGRLAHLAGIPALSAEVDDAARLLAAPAARLIAGGDARPVTLDAVEALFASPALVVDACRHRVRGGDVEISLASRPVLFALVRTLAEAWPGGVSRERLVARVFGGKRADESHRARLRVEAGRLRQLLAPLAGVEATADGFTLVALTAREVVVLARPTEERHADVLALLADGEAWSSSALALALDASQRTVQRALDALAQAGKAHALGYGRARRWTMPPAPGFATALLLPPILPGS